MQRTLLDGQSGQKFDSATLDVNVAAGANIIGCLMLEMSDQKTLTSGALAATEVLLSAGFFSTPAVPLLFGAVAGLIIDVGVQIQLSAAAAESDTALQVLVNWGASAKETSQTIRVRWRTAVSGSYQLVRVYAQAPAAPANLEITFTADAIPATETLDILQTQTRFWIFNMNGLVGASE